MRRLRGRCLVLALTSHDCNGPLRLFVRRLTEESARRSWHAATVAPVRTRRDRQIQPRTGGLFPAWSLDGSKIASSGVSTGTGQIGTLHLMNPDSSGIVDHGRN